MALLVDVGHSGWMSADELRTAIRAHAPELDIRTRADLGDPGQIRMLAVSNLSADLPALLPSLELVQKLGAGVETIVAHPALPAHVRVTRLKPDAPAREIAEWFLTYILQYQRHVRFHAAQQAQHAWTAKEPREAPETTVSVLGLGHIGSRTARMLRQVGFDVLGWSRSPKAIAGVTCHHGADALPAVLARSDYVCCILPSTPATQHLFDEKRLGSMKPGSILLNAGRGDLVAPRALLAALEDGPLAGAVLDVLPQEPLPAGDPLWSHRKAIITPHISGWHLGDALKDVAENYHRLTTGTPLLHEVDRIRGY
jgi:glyoxylate/hydroxypyruvate reductase A